MIMTFENRMKLCIGIVLSLVIVLLNTIISFLHWILRIWVQFPAIVLCMMLEWVFSRMTYGIAMIQLNLYWGQLNLHRWSGLMTDDIEFIVEDIRNYLKREKDKY